MDLLETVLRTSGFENYQDVFKQNAIDSYTLKILNDEDLKVLGILDEQKRKHFLKIADNLQIPSEEKISTLGDKSYTILVLRQMSFHLQKQLANLTIALNRKEVDICDVRLISSVLSLQYVLTSLQAQVNDFDHKVWKVNTGSRKNPLVIPALVLVATMLVTCCRYMLLRN